MSPAAIPTTIEREVSKIVADVLQAEMGLDDAHCLLGNQKWDIPEDKQLFVVVFDQTPVPVGSTKYLDVDPLSKTLGSEVQQITVVHDVRVEIMSLDSGEARQRKEEVTLALNSIYADQLAEKYRIQIAKPQAPVDASETEATARLQKFVTHVNVTALHQKVKDPPKGDYFNKFNGATVDGTAKPPETKTQ